MTYKLPYRVEIDGLRALAVLPVIFFHAGFEIFNGGFVGVDVFFVVSGYLITLILIHEFDNNYFSIVAFYERRMRRILPALFFIQFISICFAWIWMSPTQMKDFSHSLVATSIFASNILFWRESGYFEASTEQKPLLHTWSLAVEEQYYILFPIFLIVAWRFGKTRLLWVLIICATCSLLLSEWGSRNKEVANFYLTPTRAWEILAGSIAAFIVHKQGVKNSNPLSLFGLIAIVFSIFVYDEATPFPSLYTLIPVLGVVLIILYAGKKSIVSKFLGAKIFVGAGLISYSAYLWHQPLFAFARIKSETEPSILLMAVLAFSSLFLAYFSWRFIEAPFRNKASISQRKIFIFSAAGLIGFIAFGVTGHNTNGFRHRLEQYQLEILSWEEYPRASVYREGDCFLSETQSYTFFDTQCTHGKTKTLIWGDSHAAALSSGWRKLSDLHQLTASLCPPILETNFPARPECGGINNYVIDTILNANYETVILHAGWTMYTNDQLENLSLTINRLRQIGIDDIILIGGVPQYPDSLPTRLLKENAKLDSISVITQNQAEVIRVDNTLLSFINKQDVTFVKAVDVFCDANQCKVTTEFQGKIVPMAWDYGHLTEGGATWLSKELHSELIK